LGLEADEIRSKYVNGHRVNEVRLHQTALTKAIVQRYKDSTGYTKLRPVATPGFSRFDQADKEDDDKPGKFGKDAPRHLGGIQYIARGTREDVQETVSGLARNMKKWSVLDDRRLHKLMCYLEHHSDNGIMIRVDVDTPWEDLFLKVYVDADHGGDLRTARSTGGCVAQLKDSGETLVPLSHWSKAESTVSLSTGEAEFAALTSAVKRTALPMQDLLEMIFAMKSMLMEMNVDNSAALAIGNSGVSKQLKYMQKHKKLRIAFVREVFDEKNKDRVLKKVATDDNLADTMTKSLDKVKHDILTRGYGMVSQDSWEKAK
jgi:hypothetical protein